MVKMQVAFNNNYISIFKLIDKTTEKEMQL